MKVFIHQQFNWPNFTWENDDIINLLSEVRNLQGRLIAKCSKDTAIRDINDLIDKHILQKESAGGRSTNYELKVV